MEKIFIRDEFIKLGQALKLSGSVDSGVEAKYAVTEGEVKINDEICTLRGKKLFENDIIEFEGKKYIISRQ